MEQQYKYKKWVCIGLFLIAMIVCFTTGCEKKEYLSGDIEGYHYEETDEVTNYVKLTTNHDQVILIELYPDEAPITVENFQNLVKDEFYDGIIFHRVDEDFVIQAGDPTGTGMGGSGKTIKGEFASNGVENSIKHEAGVLSMARSSDYDSASSQFFICTSDSLSASALDGDYAAFGRVIAGMDAVLEIASVEVDDNERPISAQRIETMRFVHISENTEE